LSANFRSDVHGASYERYAIQFCKLFGRAKSCCGACGKHGCKNSFCPDAIGHGDILALLAEIFGIEYLRHAKHLCISRATMKLVRSVEDAKALEGVEIGVSDWAVIDQTRIDQFAEATADYQWIHVDTERAAREMPDGKTIAHGYLTLALIPALTADFIEFEGLARAINFGCNKVRFYTPLPEGARVRARGTVLQARRRAGALLLTSEVRIEVEDERKPACVAEILGMYFFAE